MAAYTRTTRECTWQTMQPVLATAVADYLETHQLTHITDAALLCIETVSTKPGQGLFRRKKEELLVGVMLAPPWLLWATSQNRQTAVVTAVLLNQIALQAYETSPMYQLMPDSGININGLRTDSVALGSTFIGLGPEPAAQKFRQLLTTWVKDSL